jgi:DNA-binding CsgD family transcriptional regulator
MARLDDHDAVARAHAAADTFDGISMPYYAAYFRFREAEATLEAGDRAVGTGLLQLARGTTRAHGFVGLDAAITALARTHQLRIGPGRTTVDGDAPLSLREQDVLHFMADGMSNPEIAEKLCISRSTAAAHVSGILRKFGATSRVEAVSDAHRRGVI